SWASLTAVSGGKARRHLVVGAVDVVQYFRHGGEGFRRDRTIHVDGGQHLRQIRVFAHLHPIGEGDGQDLLGQGSPAGGGDPGRVGAGLLLQRHGDGAAFRRSLRVGRIGGGRHVSGSETEARRPRTAPEPGKNCRNALKKGLNADQENPS